MSLGGWLVLPLAQRLFRFLPDRGFTLMRPLALLGWGYLFWLLTYLGILQNDAGGVLLALLILAVISLAAGKTRLADLWKWIKAEKRLVLTVEVLFLLAFALWAFIRAANPEVNYTEKPMELAFINSIVRSPGFPPNDPWLSGYAISYYYFGYVMVAMLVHITGTVTSAAFNIAVALWFALVAVAGYGVVYNLLAKTSTSRGEFGSRRAAGWALLAPLFILLVSNLSGLLDMLHALGLFWTQGADGQLHSTFWTWLNIRDINVPPMKPFGVMPQRGGWLWWMGSRVVQDFNLAGNTIEVIDEFPFFTYLLADLHPHVLGMPFVITAIGVAQNLAYRGQGEQLDAPGNGKWLRSFDFWPTAILLGGLSFLNTWDFPIYVALFAGVFVWQRARINGWGWLRAGEFIRVGLLLGIAGGVLYLPFYIGFSSQAGGLLPSLAFQTRGVYFLVMFLPLLLPIGLWLVSQIKKVEPKDVKKGWLISGGVVIILFVLMLAVGKLFDLAQKAGMIWQQNGGILAGKGGQIASAINAFWLTQLGDPALLNQSGANAQLLIESLMRRISSPVTWLVLLVVIALALAALSFGRRNQESDESTQSAPDSSPGSENTATGFVALLILAGAVLTLLPEFFYLKDGFGSRMNTIFKFYFQTWIFWGLAAAYSFAVLWRDHRKIGGLFIKTGLVVMTAAALIYPAVMLPAKTGLPGKPLSELTLDGKAYLQKYNPDEWAAFIWLRQAPIGVVAETAGIQYNPDTARVSTHSGQPTILGWEGHEWQWRGGTEEIGSRRGGLEVLYTSDNWEDVRAILLRYKIRYIYIGPVERTSYRVNEVKFQANLPIVFQNAAVTIYEVPGENPMNEPVSLSINQ